jgi:hypothetical protein
VRWLKTSRDSGLLVLTKYIIDVVFCFLFDVWTLSQQLSALAPDFAAKRQPLLQIKSVTALSPPRTGTLPYFFQNQKTVL